MRAVVEYGPGTLKFEEVSRPQAGEFGKNVKGFSVGDRIITDQIIPCGQCRDV
jgi:hypothetical protein